MKKNVGNVDRIIRLLIAAVIAVLFLTKTFTGTLGIILLVVAAILILTSLINFCPIYAILGIKTRKND